MISVIIPLYNKEKSIANTIFSVLNQKFHDFELIVVDDGSTDHSLGVVNGIYDKRIRLISQTNGGVSEARNNGIRLAKFDYIALIDADDLWDDHFLVEMVRLIQEFPDASLYGCASTIENPDGSSFSTTWGLPMNFRGYVDYFKIGINNTLFNSSSVVFSKKSFYDIGMYDTSLIKGEDMDLWFRYALNKKIAYLNRALTYYMKTAENRAMNRHSDRKKYLIWNLDRYASYELKNNDFKVFLDSWRIAHIANYLNGYRVEVNHITSLLKEIDLTRYPYYWTIMQYLPSFLQTPYYQLRFKLKKLVKKSLHRNSNEKLS